MCKKKCAFLFAFVLPAPMEYLNIVFHLWFAYSWAFSIGLLLHVCLVLIITLGFDYIHSF